MSASAPDAVIVGSGPNGLAGAVTLAHAGLRVEVYEGAQTAGGGCRTQELTLPGFAHDVCSTVHPLLAASPFFTGETLHGVTLLHSDVAMAHPLDGGRAASLSGSVAQTAAALQADAASYRRLFGPLVEHSQAIVPSVLAPIITPPRHPLAMGRFGLRGVWPMSMLARGFRTEAARALLAGLAAHSMRPLNSGGTGAFGLLLGMLAHTVGWPVVQGGSARVVDSLVEDLEALEGTVHTGRWITDLQQLPKAKVTLLDVAPRQLLEFAGERLPARWRRSLEHYRYGPGVCKVDWALSGPAPWSADVCRSATTVHIGGTFEEIARSESEVAHGAHPKRPFCIAVQPCVADPTRAPEGKHTFYAYCHVPNGSEHDVSDRIQAQIERFAPGFGDLVLDRQSTTAIQLAQHSPNYVGGDINVGAATLRQTIFGPTISLNPYRTPLTGVYLCSSSTPPGGGVHGMCGQQAARAALSDLKVS